jgi:hypothetical protein
MLPLDEVATAVSQCIARNSFRSVDRMAEAVVVVAT